ncbi:helix-turn-helix domain-containing protein [Kitasatospora sp. YST-16]|uniref:helix-turn-helix domain-containing protein n=1 Tax=Kitasatospora sp. YST-16 TaxID=2998080 RepID=UPI0022834B93|nr:helix-turn-helix domain-containing protein [Kitasatospora sp. YST-16]WAL74570.1 helix-turn-helix domain-containing protein [Kitasatospora sp. YST-16]WNW40628.1 helix-turn-helix domain-containing protein [Streptomyces sp. Li-HN-5-13]
MPSSLMPSRTSADRALGGPGLPVPDSEQWISTTGSRIAPDPYTWMQAVHWAHDLGTRIPVRSHGPRFGTTTVLLAQQLAQLTPCRPGIDFLARILKVSARTVKYHMAILREAGLLAYRVKGTRVRQGRPLASEFARTIPSSFDQALGLRTVPSDTFIRAVVGVSEYGRAQLARLGKKAARTVRRKARSTKKPSFSASSDCTPMEGGSCTVSPAALTSSPSEDEPRSGKSSSSPTRRGRTRKALNAVGRRYQLGLELVRQVPWLAGTPVARVAWAARHLADAGWTAHEVIAVLALRAPSDRIHRPSGFLTARLIGVEKLFDTPAKRANLVAWWRHSPQASRERHVEWSSSWSAPRSNAVRRLVGEAFTASKPKPHLAELPAEPTDAEQAEIRTLAWRQYLAGQPELVISAITLAGRDSAEQIYGTDLVQRVVRLASTSSHLTTGAPR